MTIEEAKKTLSFYRPGTADEQDADFAEALELVRRSGDAHRWPALHNPELVKWFEEHCASYAAGRAKFNTITAPAGLKEQILAEKKIVLLPPPRRRMHWAAPLALAAGIVAALCVLPFLRHRQPIQDFAACRYQMVRVALNPYEMDLNSTNQDRVRSYLAERNAPANYALPTHLASAQLAGCGVKNWNDKPVAMICFRSGRPLHPGETTDLWLFVFDAQSLMGAPQSDAPVIVPVTRSTTAAWTHDGRTYLLVAAGKADFLQEYL